MTTALTGVRLVNFRVRVSKISNRCSLRRNTFCLCERRDVMVYEGKVFETMTKVAASTLM
jgi:hypothetical protein